MHQNLVKVWVLLDKSSVTAKKVFNHWPQNHNNFGQRYQNNHQHLTGYHHPSAHFSNYSNHQHHGSYSTPQPHPLFGSPPSVSAAPPTSTFPSILKSDPSQDERNENFVPEDSVQADPETFQNISPPVSTPAIASPPAHPASSTTPNAYLPHHQLVGHHHQHQSASNNNNNHHTSPLSHHVPCSESSVLSSVAQSQHTQQQQQQQQHNPVLIPHPGSSPNFNCLSPASLPMPGADPAAAMVAMTASQGGYYDMYGTGGGGSFGTKGSSFYPWMKNYSGKAWNSFCN